MTSHSTVQATKNNYEQIHATDASRYFEEAYYCVSTH